MVWATYCFSTCTDQQTILMEICLLRINAICCSVCLTQKRDLKVCFVMWWRLVFDLVDTTVWIVSWYILGSGTITITIVKLQFCFQCWRAREKNWVPIPIMKVWVCENLSWEEHVVICIAVQNVLSQITNDTRFFPISLSYVLSFADWCSVCTVTAMI